MGSVGRIAAGIGTGGLSELSGIPSALDGVPGTDFKGVGGGGKKSAPAPPDFGALASQQTAANRPNQSTPFGSTVWDPTHQSQTTSFSGPLGDAANSLQKQYADANANPLDNGQQARTAATNAVYGQETSRLDPQWKQQEESMNAQLAAQGLDPSSQAGRAQIDNFGRARNDAYSSAQNQAITMGGNAAEQQQRLDLNSREAPLQQLSGLRGLLQMPSYGQAGDLLGAGGMQNNANYQQYNANGGALGGFGQLLQSLGPLLQAYMKSQGG